MEIFERIQVPGDDEVRSILARRIDYQRQATGIALGIVEPEGRRIVAWGSLAKGDSRAVDGGTIFEIGSITKVVTSLLLAEMVCRGEVGLDDPAGKFLPENVRMPDWNGRAITLLDLATHRSGLPPLPANLKVDGGDYSVEDLYGFLSGYRLGREPGSEYEYSNLGAGLLGHVLARRAGSDYESLVRARIAEPLGMRDTGISVSAMAIGHTAMLAPVAGSDLPAPLAGAGALRASVNDMLTLIEVFLGYRESPLAPAMKLMFGVRGMGWFVGSTDGREIMAHSGATRGFASFVGCDCKARVGVVVLSNACTRCGVDDIGIHVLNPKSPLADLEPPETRTEIPIDPAILDRYIGRYQVNANLILEISRDGGRLFAQGFAGVTALPRFELSAEGEGRFFAKVSDSRVTFVTDEDGKTKGLILKRGGRDMPAAPRLL